MMIVIALIRLNNDVWTILRGHPHVVLRSFIRSQRRAGGGEMLHQVYGTVRVVSQENDLWPELIALITDPEMKSFAVEKYEIWKRKAAALWTMHDPEGVCIFRAGQEEPILQIPDRRDDN